MELLVADAKSEKKTLWHKNTSTDIAQSCIIQPAHICMYVTPGGLQLEFTGTSTCMHDDAVQPHAMPE